MNNFPFWLLFVVAIWVYHFVVWTIFRYKANSDITIPSDKTDEITPMKGYFIKYKSTDYRLMVIGIVSLACKGFLDIVDDDGEFILYKRNDIPKDHPPEEALIFNTLFKENNSALIGYNNFNTIHMLRLSLTGMVLSPEFKSRYFVKSRAPLYVGTVFSVSTLIYYAAIEHHAAFILLSVTAVANFFIYLFLLETYTRRGVEVLDHLMDVEYGNDHIKSGDIYGGIPWSMVFGQEAVYDTIITGETCEWFDVFDEPPANYLTGMQREKNRKEQSECFVSWLSKTMLWTLLNLKVAFRAQTPFDDQNPLVAKRSSQKEKLENIRPKKKVD